MKIMKISLEELNIAYTKVNQIKRELQDNGKSLPLLIDISIDRNPLIDEYFDDESEFITPFRLKFELISTPITTYRLDTKVEIIDEDEE